MLFGYVEDNSYNILNDDEDPILNATYYYGTNEDGARHSGWLQYTDALTDKDEDYYWFYFNTSNGKKVKADGADQYVQKSINGKKYSFDTDGIMSFKWSKATVGGVLTTTWFNQLADGSLAKNQWIWNKPYTADKYAEKGTAQDVEDETNRWFRTDASGSLIKGKTRKINSKWYVFDGDGVMRTGLVVLSDSEGSVSGADFVKAYDMDNVTKADLDAAKDGKALHYFSEDEEKDGSMKTGTMKIELADDEYTFCFTKNTGAAKNGYDSSSKKIYNNGILEKADDDKYTVAWDCSDDNNKIPYLVGSTGSVVKSVNKYKDANDKYYIYRTGVDGHKWAIYSTYNEDDAKEAVKAETSKMPASVERIGYGPLDNK